ncbi:MAG: HK97 family phage prohead protease [Rhodospirillaceae bacterium]|nr:HK97 family phage prohead protease [Rhodospirillaceae bacterium]
MIERRSIAVEIRADGRKLTGPALVYGDVSPSHRERIEPGAVQMAATVPLNLEHDAMRGLAWQPDGGLSFEDSETELRMMADLPPLPACDAALEAVRQGRMQGLSIEFKALAERRESGLRVIEKLELRGIALTGRPSYSGSRVEARAARRRIWL